MQNIDAIPSSSPSSPLGVSKEWLYLAGVLTGFIGRSLWHWFEQFFYGFFGCDKCAEKGNEARERLLPVSEMTMKNLINNSEISWKDACAGRGMTKWGGILSGGLTLFFWHLSQPTFYFIVFYVYYFQLDPTQRWLGTVVAAREGLYALMVLGNLFVCPAFLLVDMRATWRDNYQHYYGIIYTIGYVFAPEKFILLCLETPTIKLVLLIGTVLVVLDLFGIAALVAAVKSGNVFPAMIVGYAVTTVGGILAVLMLVHIKITYGCDRL